MGKHIHFHAVGIALGMLVFAIYWGLRMPSPNIAIADQGSSFQTFASNDIIGLSRLSATKAMDRNANVGWAYAAAALCSDRLAVAEAKEPIILAVASPMENANERLELSSDLSKIDGADGLSSVQDACRFVEDERLANEGFVAITNSYPLFMRLKKDGFKPSYLTLQK